MGFTTNYWNAFKCMMEKNVITNGATSYDGSSVNCGYFGSSSYISDEIRDLSLKRGSFLLNNYNAGWTVGAGDTAESESDYKLDNLITYGISGSVNQTGEYTIITLTNTSSSNITIKEVGESMYIPTSASSSSGTTCLAYRKVLATPLVLTPGDTGAITVSVNFTPPT